MKPHKHAELIKAWADGVEIQYKSKFLGTWHLFNGNKDAWVDDYEYRIKPEPKTDFVMYGVASFKGVALGMTNVLKQANLILTFDGETGKLKDSEVING